MSLIDLLLNLAALLLWFQAKAFQKRSRQRSPFSVVPASSAPPIHRVRWLIAAGVFLFVRGLFYWYVGSRLHWTPAIELGPVSLSFRSDFLTRIILFSVLSFLLTFGVFYSVLLFGVVLARKNLGSEPLLRWMRSQLGFLDRLPALILLLLPFAITGISWCLLEPPLVKLNLIPPPKSWAHLFEQALLIGASSLLIWKYFIATVLLLHLVNSYVYLGSGSLLLFVNTAGQRLLRPFRWIPLRIGPVDFTPLALVAALFLGAQFAARGLLWLYLRLPW